MVDKGLRKVFPNTISMLRRMGKTDKEITDYLNSSIKQFKKKYGGGRK